MDAELEYEPPEFPRLFKPVLDGKTDVVYGSHFMGAEAHHVVNAIVRYNPLT